ncbi:ribbon-helix-helix protein, CopG family [Serratia nevei]|uniref:ribbon-helix-helix protein, CopG family n=1 Tax=Serratia nevei TaxID=2703794 RepID=UPI00254C76DE|nr:ribbon-helix-helix protein, CopG family [Serratia nevei]MDK5224729.1 ribbon-helix-helix protein, CopG family [Serratia nevei]
MPQLSIRLPDDLVQLLDERASAEHLTRTDITAAALRAYLGVVPAPAAADKLDRVIELLETIAGAPQRKTAAPQRQTVPDKPEMQRTTTPPNAPRRTTSDPRFQAVDSEADALIVSLTQQGAGLADIAAQLNAQGFRSATGGEWSRSKLRDYRHKLRDAGLI